MAGNFIELEQAAEMLGVTTDQLNDMRLSGEIHAMRDGSGWKFKQDELERVAEDRGISLSGDDEIDLDDEDLMGSDISDLAIELEADEEGNSPTVIGAAEGDEASEQPEADEPAGISASEDSATGISDIDLSLEDSDLSLESPSGDLSVEPEVSSDMLPAESDILGGTECPIRLEAYRC